MNRLKKEEMDNICLQWLIFAYNSFRSNSQKVRNCRAKLDVTHPSTVSCSPTPGNLLDIYSSCCLVTFGIHLDTYNSNFLDY